MANTEKGRDAWNSMTPEQQKAVVDTIIGEANVKSPADVRAIVDSITARSLQLGVTPFDVVSAEKDGEYQYDAYGDLPPAGNAKYADMAAEMMKQSLTRADPNAATFYAKPEAVAGLPEGLAPYPTIGSPHQFYTDPQNRSILTAQGYKNPQALDQKVAALDAAVDAVPDTGAGLMMRPSQDPVAMAKGFDYNSTTGRIPTPEIASFMRDELGAGKVTTEGRAFNNQGVPRTDIGLMSAIAAAVPGFEATRPGYDVDILGPNSLTRGGTHTGNHGTPSGSKPARAMDAIITNPAGDRLASKQNPYSNEVGTWQESAPVYQDYANRVAINYAAQNPESVPSDMRWGGYFQGGVPRDQMHLDTTFAGRSRGPTAYGDILEGYNGKKGNPYQGGGVLDALTNQYGVPQFTANPQQDARDYGLAVNMPEAWAPNRENFGFTDSARKTGKMGEALWGKAGTLQMQQASPFSANQSRPTVPSVISSDPRLDRPSGSMPQSNKPPSAFANDPRLSRVPGAIQRSVPGLPAVPSAPVGIAALGNLPPNIGGNMPGLPGPRPGNETVRMFNSLPIGKTFDGKMPSGGTKRDMAAAYRDYQQATVPGAAKQAPAPGYMNTVDAQRYSRMPDPRAQGWRNPAPAAMPSRMPDQSQRFAPARTGTAPSLGGNMPGLPGPRPGNATVSMFDPMNKSPKEGFINTTEAQRYSKMPDPRAQAYKEVPPQVATPRTVSVADLANAKPSFSRPQYSPPTPPAPAGIPAAPQVSAGTAMNPSQLGGLNYSNPAARGPAVNNPPVPQRAPMQNSIVNPPVPQRAPSMNVPVPQRAPSFAPTPAKASPAMSASKAKSLGMTETVPGKFMPDVKGNPAQVLRDQLGLIARNPIQSIGQMIAGTMLGGVFHAGGNPFQNMAQKSAAGAGIASLGGAGGGSGGGGNFGGGGGGFASNRGSDGGFNSGYTSSSGFTYDK